MTMRISMPLAGMDPPNTSSPPGREEMESRAFRMLSEGELFYVETDLHEDALSSSRHDHGHLGGVSLEEVSKLLARGAAEAAEGSFAQNFHKLTESDAETEATSRSSSQDTTETDETWRPSEVGFPSYAARTPNPFAQHRPYPATTANNNNNNNTISSSTSDRNNKAPAWNYAKLHDFDDIDCGRNTRERSFSAPHLTRNLNQYDSRTAYNKEWLSSTRKRGGTIPEASSNAYAYRSSRRNSLPNPDDLESEINANDICRGAAFKIQDTWNRWFGSEGLGSRRVEGMSQHLSSCTSTKTFEVSPSACDRDTLARLGIVPDNTCSLAGFGSMTFIMHIAGHRVVSTTFGRHAEYEVRVKGGGRRWSRWQRFSKFKQIAACVDKDKDSVAAWGRVVSNQPGYRCLHPDYLAQKCNRLEMFLQQVMFAMPTPALIIHFVNQQQ